MPLPGSFLTAYNDEHTRYATFDWHKRYRYKLGIVIPQPTRVQKPCTIIMLNPSTADEMKNDPTVSRCVSLAQREGCNHLTVVNLFALRSTDPKMLYKAKDPVGPLNDYAIEEAIGRTLLSANGLVIAAWGSHKIAQERGNAILDVFGPMWCLGTTKDGSPRHPLYVKRDKKLEVIQ